MTKEEFRDIIKNIPTETSRIVISSFNGVSISDLENVIERLGKIPNMNDLLKEYQQLKEELNTCMIERNKFLDIIEGAIKQTEFLDRQFRKHVTPIPSKEVLDLLEILNSYKGEKK